MASTHHRPYAGGFVDGGTDMEGRPHGFVKFTCGDVVYRGLMSHGNEDGPGCITYANGYTFEGVFSDGRTTSGTVKDEKGNVVYIGEYDIYYTYHGIGRETYPDGSFYVGEFRRGKRHGCGVMTYAENNVYDGEWKNGFRHGMATYQFPNGDVISGEWVDDKNETLSAINKSREFEDELHILQDTVDPMARSLDRLQSVCDSLFDEAKKAGADPIALNAIMNGGNE